MERFHQTLKKFIKEQDAIETKRQLQAQLDRFVTYYNDIRPHRAIGRKTPAEVYAAREKARPSSEPLDLSGGRKLRHDKLDQKGTVTLRINHQMHHIPCGCTCRRGEPNHSPTAVGQGSGGLSRRPVAAPACLCCSGRPRPPSSCRRQPERR